LSEPSTLILTGSSDCLRSTEHSASNQFCALFVNATAAHALTGGFDHCTCSAPTPGFGAKKRRVFIIIKSTAPTSDECLTD
jgi:hypothetical protein